MLYENSFFTINLFLAVNNCVDAFPRAGIVEILNYDLDPFPVYCDQTNDEGGGSNYSLLIMVVSCFFVVIVVVVVLQSTLRT